MPRKLICFAHRGASGHAPENTLAAFKKAVALGADWIELDVYTVDGELVVIHDNRLERTTNGTGTVARRGVSYLRRLDAGQGEQIPFLGEVLDTVARRIKVNIELKGPQTAKPVVSLLNHYVRNHGWTYDQFLVSSFDHKQVATTKAACAQLPVGINLKKITRDETWIPKQLDLFSVHVDVKSVSADIIGAIHCAGCLAFVFTVNTRTAISKVAQMGADGVFTNFPEKVLNFRY